MDYEEFLGILLDSCMIPKEDALDELVSYLSKNYEKSAETPEIRFMRAMHGIVDRAFERNKHYFKIIKDDKEQHKPTECVPAINITGKYSVNSTAETVTIEQKGIDCIVSSSNGWKGKGYVINRIYAGTYIYPPDGKGEHLLLIKQDQNLVGIWHSETHGSGLIEWTKKYIAYPRTEQQMDMNAPFEEH